MGSITLVKKWVDKVIDMRRVSDRTIFSKVWFQGSIISVISVYDPKLGLNDGLISVVRKVGEKEIVGIAEDFNAHIGSSTEDHKDQDGGYGCGVGNKGGERILEFCAVMNMTVRNLLFKERLTHLATYELGSSKVRLYFGKKKRKEVLKNIKVLP